MLATCPAHLNLLDLITLTILGERYIFIYHLSHHRNNVTAPHSHYSVLSTMLPRQIYQGYNCSLILVPLKLTVLSFVNVEVNIYAGIT